MTPYLVCFNEAIAANLFKIAMGFDLLILVFTCTALLRNSNRSGLWQLLFRDGLVYWGLAFSANAVPAVSTIQIKSFEEIHCV